MLQLTFQVPSGVLTAGSNSIDLVTPSIPGVDDVGGLGQVCFLYSLSMNYTRSLDGSSPVEVVNNGAANTVFELSNMPSANAWVVDERFPTRAALVPMQTQQQADGTYKLRFTAGTGGSAKYLIVPAGQENQPLAVTKVQVKPLALSGVYLATGPSQFSSGVQALLMQRSKEGLRAQYVDQEQLFDFYNYGRYGPVGIQNAVRSTLPLSICCCWGERLTTTTITRARTSIRSARHSWSRPRPGLRRRRIRCLETWGADIRKLRWADCRRNNTPSELSGAVQHILTYPGAPLSAVRVNASTDQADPLVANFPAQADAIAAQNPDLTWQRDYLGVTYQTTTEVTAAITAAANGGADWLLYVGHGNAAHLGAANRRILGSNRCSEIGPETWSSCNRPLHGELDGQGRTQDYKSLAIQARGAYAAAGRHLRQRGHIDVHEFRIMRLNSSRSCWPTPARRERAGATR